MSGHKIGVALSGGGARGIAHLGVVKALRELGYEIEAYSGVSSGAIAAAFLAGGLSPDEVLHKFLNISLYPLLRPAIGAIGLLNSSQLEKLFQRQLPVNTFEELQVPLIIGTTDIVQGRRVYFSKGDIIKPLAATSAVPIVYHPVEYQGMQLVDGGLLNNLPTEPLVGRHRNIVGVHTNMVTRQLRLDSTRHMMERTFQLLLSQNVESSTRYCDWLIEPAELDKYSVLNYGKARELFDIGYQYTLKHAEQGRKALAHDPLL
jgi:NTE family protein